MKKKISKMFSDDYDYWQNRDRVTRGIIIAIESLLNEMKDEPRILSAQSIPLLERLKRTLKMRLKTMRGVRLVAQEVERRRKSKTRKTLT